MEIRIGINENNDYVSKIEYSDEELKLDDERFDKIRSDGKLQMDKLIDTFSKERQTKAVMSGINNIILTTIKELFKQ
jgi:cell fate (sporulation/competence/biofilm development) regulator YlbF (YheA/YmcA/DUF963 family)